MKSTTFSLLFSLALAYTLLVSSVDAKGSLSKRGLNAKLNKRFTDSEGVYYGADRYFTPDEDDFIKAASKPVAAKPVAAEPIASKPDTPAAAVPDNKGQQEDTETTAAKPDNEEEQQEDSEVIAAKPDSEEEQQEDSEVTTAKPDSEEQQEDASPAPKKETRPYDPEQEEHEKEEADENEAEEIGN